MNVRKIVTVMLVLILMIFFIILIDKLAVKTEPTDLKDDNLSVEIPVKINHVVAYRVGSTFGKDVGKLSGQQEGWVLVNFGDKTKFNATTNCYNNETLVENFDSEIRELDKEGIMTWYALCHNPSVTYRNVSIEYII